MPCYGVCILSKSMCELLKGSKPGSEIRFSFWKCHSDGVEMAQRRMSLEVGDKEDSKLHRKIMSWPGQKKWYGNLERS